MLVVSEKRLVPVHINTIVLQGEDGLYYYLHRDLYDQLTVLSDIYGYGEKFDPYVKNLTDVPSMKELPANVLEFYERTPWPIKAAAPFLMYISKVAELTAFEDMVGAISVMSMSINFRTIPKVDKALRAALSFSLSIREEYQPTWDRFFQENPEYGAAAMVPSYAAPNYTTSDGNTVVHNEETGVEEEVVVEGPPLDLEALRAAMGMDDSNDDEEYEDDEEEGASHSKSGFSRLQGV